MRINEIFYSLQGEGCRTGMPSVFVRFSGCNLNCPFCDTTHTEGEEMDESDIIKAIKSLTKDSCCGNVVFTGGEPTLQLTDSLIDRLHAAGYYIQIETNGILPVPDSIDWVTCSPKTDNPIPARIDELKVLYGCDTPEPDKSMDPGRYNHISARVRSLQPIDTGDAERNRAVTAAAIEYVKHHPQWRLSLQTHKITGIR